jgi:L-fuculokinase
MMAMDLARRTWSPKLLKLAGVEASFFPRFVESGETIGTVTPKASKATGIPAGTPVTAAGHDTQFAPIGSGARPGEAILSSGTWEILMARVPQFKANRAGFDGGLIIEADALPGLFNPQLLMMGSGVLEWLAKHVYADVNDTPKLYPTMIGEAASLAPGAGGVMLIPSFVAGTGPTKRYGTLGTLLGLTIATQRGQVYRAALEGLACQLQLAIEMLRAATGFQPKGIRVVGGGSKNDLWNQIRADVTGLPVTTIEQKEATVLGAAICAFVGTGVYPSVESAQQAMKLDEVVFSPSNQSDAYQSIYAAYKSLLPDLKRHYS